MAMCAVCGGDQRAKSVERLQSHRKPSVAAMRREHARLCTRPQQQGASLQLITRAGVGVVPEVAVHAGVGQSAWIAGWRVDGGLPKP